MPRTEGRQPQHMRLRVPCYHLQWLQGAQRQYVRVRVPEHLHVAEGAQPDHVCLCVSQQYSQLLRQHQHLLGGLPRQPRFQSVYLLMLPTWVEDLLQQRQ